MLKSVRSAVVASCFACMPLAALAQEPAGPLSDTAAEAAPEMAITPVSPDELEAAIAEFEASLEHRKGKVAIPAAHVMLNVPDGFYFLDASDAQDVLEDAWGNPPDATVSGMIFPEGSSPMKEDAWGVVLTFEETGYVSDEDASGLDYDMLIDAMRDGLDQENAQRKTQGYPSIDIIGWAAEPRYDAATHKLYWAKEIAFGGEPVHTLNYDMRVLGRQGVLSLNFVATVDQLAEIEKASPAVLAIPEFDSGFRYADFDAAVDKKADFGVVGLIGGAAAAAALAKNGGLLAAALLFLKKGWILIVGAFAGIGALYRAIFNRKPKAQARAEQTSATAFFDAPPAPEPDALSAPDSSKPPPSA